MVAISPFQVLRSCTEAALKLHCNCPFGPTSQDLKKKKGILRDFIAAEMDHYFGCVFRDEFPHSLKRCSKSIAYCL